jgi:hypothetical protein
VLTVADKAAALAAAIGSISCLFWTERVAEMNRDELFASIVAARPGRDDTVYVERRGQDYDWRIVPLGEAGADSARPAADPDVWMSLSATWPLDDPARIRAFFEDLLAELESMADTTDRCRWPIDQPWPHFH